MQLYVLDKPPRQDLVAYFAHVGTWVKILEGKDVRDACPACAHSIYRLVSPLVIQNSDGAELPLLDCSWCMRCMIFTEECAQRIESAGLRARFDPVEVRYEGRGEAGNNVHNPFTGRRFRWPLGAVVARLDLARMEIPESPECPRCKERFYTSKKEPLHLLCEPGSEDALISVREFTSFWGRRLFVSEVGRELMNRAKVTNVDLRCVGEVEFVVGVA